MQFSKELRDQVTAGDITVSFRLWQRPQVKEGGRYWVGPAEIEVDSVDLMPFAAITPEDVRRSGEPAFRTWSSSAIRSGEAMAVIAVPKMFRDGELRRPHNQSAPRIFNRGIEIDGGCRSSR